MSILVDAPARVDGVQFLGEAVGSGYRTPPALVRRADGQVLQLTPLVYQVLHAADGRRSCAEIAEVVGLELGRTLTEADVRLLVDQQLRPRGLLALADGSEPELKRSDPLLGLKARIAVTNPRTTHRLTEPFRVLFRPVIVTAVLLGFVAVVGWVFFERGLGASAYDAFERPHLLLLVFAVTVLSGGFHEFGHAAAARYSGATPGVMGAGLYLVWPAFYTDVTDSYRLDRAGRIRTDLGGLYFNAVVVVLTFAWWWATGWEALLLLVATQVMQMMQQLLPFFRFDGYHLLADLAGVPDLYQRIRSTLVGLLPHRWNSPENRMLTPGARVVITLWVLVTVPMMALMLFALIGAVPPLLGSAGSVIREDAAAVGRALGDGNPLDVAAHTLQLLGVVLPMLGCALILSRVGGRFFAGLARWSHGSAGKRVVAAVVAATAVTVLAWAWWPHPGAYRPIQPGERGLVTSLAQLPQVQAPSVLASDRAPLVEVAQTQAQLSSSGPLVAVFEEGAELPTQDNPAVAWVLIPSQSSGTSGTDNGPRTVADPTPRASPDATSGTTAASAPSSLPDTAPDNAPSDVGDDPWVFPFDKPLPPDEGDNQALATVTSDDSVVYDVAFALVWAEDDEVLNVNEAHAYASCSNCVAVAVAFQVVLVMEDAHVVVPQNLAVAANYDCYQCITAAIASQLVLTVEEQPGEAQLLALGAVWNQLLEFAATITSYSVTQIMEQLETVQSEIVAILAAAPAGDILPSTTVPASGGSSSTAPPGSSSPTPGSTQSPPSPTGQPTAGSPTPSSTDPSTSPSPTDSPTAPPSASPSPSPSDPPSTPSESPTSPSASPSESPTAPSPTATSDVTQVPTASASP